MSSTESTPDREDAAGDQRPSTINEQFRVAPLRETGWRPIGVVAGATVVKPPRRAARQHIAERLLADLADLVQRHRSSAPPSEYADLHAELITAEVAHHLALARTALHRHRPSRPTRSQPEGEPS